MPEESIELFLEELTVLSQKHSIGINGCGYCGFPFLYDLGKSDENKKHVVNGKTDLELK